MLDWAIPWKNRLVLYEKQRQAIIEPPQDAVIEASPKAGKTIGCLQWLIEETERVGAPNRRFLWVAPTYRQAQIAFMRAYTQVLDYEQLKVHKTDHTITLPSECVIYFASADREDTLYGEDYWAIVVDEGSRVSEDAWIAIQSTVNHTGGRIRVIMNVKDRRNWAYRLARRAERGDTEHWTYARLTQDDAMAAGVVDALDDERARERLTDDQYQSLYYAYLEETGGTGIHIENIDRAPVPESALWCRAWDFATTLGGDWTVGAKIAATPEGFWIVNVVRDRRESPEIPDLVRQTAAFDGPQVDQVLEEEKGSSGSLFVSTMREQLAAIPTAGPVWPAGVEQQKELRAWPLAVAIREGRYHFAPECDTLELLPELGDWPYGRYDDQVDALAHAHNHLAPMVMGMVGSGWVPR